MKKYNRFMLVFTILLSTAGCKEEILHDLSETRANQALLILQEANIEGEKARSGKEWLVRVEKPLAMEALAVIERSRLLVRDLERFKEQSHGLMQSREDRAQANERQLAWNLENTLERIPGVREAKVHLSLEEDSPLAKAKKPTSSASVLLVLSSEDPQLTDKVKQLVAGAGGFPQAQVSVVTSKLETVSKKIVPLPVSAGFEVPKWLFAVGGALILVLTVSVIRRRRPRNTKPRTISMLADQPLRPQPSFSEPQSVTEPMELQ